MRPERFKVVYTMDPAIDTESMPFEVMQEYIEKRDYNTIAPYFKPGMKPTVYHVRAVHHSMWETFVMAGGDHVDIRFRRAFLCGIDNVDDLYGRDGTSVNFEPTRNVPGVGKVFTEDEVNLRFSPGEVLEIGSVIYEHSFLHPRIALTWQLPSTCVGPLVSRKFRSAAANPSTAETTTSEPRSGTTAAIQETPSA